MRRSPPRSKGIVLEGGRPGRFPPPSFFLCTPGATWRNPPRSAAISATCKSAGGNGHVAGQRPTSVAIATLDVQTQTMSAEVQLPTSRESRFSWVVRALLSALCTVSHAQVASYTVKNAEGRVELTSVTVTREGKQPQAVARESLWERFREGSLAGVDEIVFAVREPGTDHWYANFGFYSSPRNEDPPQRAPGGKITLPKAYKGGGRLCRYNLRSGKLDVLLDDPSSCVRDPHVHYDGKTVLFSYRPPGDAHFHLYEIVATGGGPPRLRQLTHGPWNDIEPVYLPDDRIMFCSDRCRRFVNCWVTPVANLHICDRDGGGVRAVSTNIEHDNTPWVLPDGRVLYMRWEYVDRNQVAFHHLWTTAPDGTGQTVYFGNQHRGIAMLDAKPIPGTPRVVSVFSPGHGRYEHAGYVTVVDPAAGPDEQGSAQQISQGGPNFRDPYAFSEDCFLVARDREILLMDGKGQTEPLYALPPESGKLQCHEPRPLRARPREVTIPSRVDHDLPTGQLVLNDVYTGRNMEGVRRGEIKELLILEQLPKPVNFSGGPWPISNGGTFTLSRLLGTVPVEPDGSAFMEVPAMRSLFFVALDEKGLSVKRMQSFLSVQPGEVTGCVGCHEARVTAPPASAPRPLAMKRKPSRIEPIPGVPDVMDYHRDVQPILDRHCVNCHNPDDYKGGVNLAGDHTPRFCESYWTMLQRGLISDGRNESGNRAPRTIGSSASRLFEKTSGKHNKVCLDPMELKTLRLWIDSSAAYAGTYGALGSGMCPVEFPVEAMIRRCARCHGHKAPENKIIGGHKTVFRFGENGPALPLVGTLMHLRDIRGKIGYYKFGWARPPQAHCNLTRPEKSLLLRAPLAKKAGGLGLCGKTVFDSREDADYQALLSAVRDAAGRHREAKRFDMGGYRPNDYYLYQMVRYGILDAIPDPEETVDPYAVDRAYWEAFWYR